MHGFSFVPIMIEVACEAAARKGASRGGELLACVGATPALLFLPSIGLPRSFSAQTS